ncbi:enoyl-CoA hydratase/isomerase family protein [Vulgatibacter incomptus]|uniref:Enoyl-CoA hydratase n=1 Tax=Vulgatibacter incomptus TaxID=1391653 RepID=A0A0K1PBR6_9BACT|nr:enoyl-CoA hydratase-related protein [Vulgatibacter incomptus]AKU90846.1 Enoyl-CoA hydratase [Vulgatibacter incomptus]
MAYANLKVTRREDGVAWIEFDRPKALNAFNTETLLELESALDVLSKDESLRVLVLTGAGEKAFVAGADIAEMAEMGAPRARVFSSVGHRVFEKLEKLPVPTIAAVNGFALGGGMEVALACDLIYAADKAKFGQPEVNLGVIPGFGGSQRLPRKIGPMRALELCFTGDIIAAAKAQEVGLVLEVFPAAELRAKVDEIAMKIASKAPLAISAMKRVVVEASACDPRTANALEQETFGVLFGSEDQKEGMKAFLEKRPADFRAR